MAIYTLLLVFHGIMQAWVNEESRYSIKYALDHVTKSGLVGFLANCEGRDREDDISDLAKLRFGVRIDNPHMSVGDDFQTTHTTMFKKKDNAWKEQSYVSHRQFLEDAYFLVGIESENRNQLENIRQAVLYPKRAPYFGRRCCLATDSIRPHIVRKDLHAALLDEPWTASEYMQEAISLKEKRRTGEDIQNVLRLRILTECAPSEADYRDLTYPISFSRKSRKYGYCYMRDVSPKEIYPDENGMYKEESNTKMPESTDFFHEARKIAKRSRQKNTSGMDFFEAAKKGVGHDSVQNQT